MTKNLNNLHKDLKSAVACIPLNEKNIAQEKRVAMLKNLQKQCKKYVIPIRVKNKFNDDHLPLRLLKGLIWKKMFHSLSRMSKM